MASIFTYDPNPPRVSSPWLRPAESTPTAIELGDTGVSNGFGSPNVTLLADCGIAKLEAEPQDGPIEYKLHLLLRPRRSYSVISTGSKVSGSAQSRSKATTPEPPASTKNLPSLTPAPSFVTRQNRLQHLTTQLLWRLQQSSPYHLSSTANLVMPNLPGRQPGSLSSAGNLLPGLEESEGALYEIGVSDDGTFVGLTKAEMDESLLNLRSMAASLGCEVKVLRNVIVGECEWTEKCSSQGPEKTHVEKLWVSEALVVPGVRRHELGRGPSSSLKHSPSDIANRGKKDRAPCSDASRTEQLRVSLTGSTTSGKSTLLGTLSTSTLDNGRGKSRLSLLKHRHEIVSGVTSSVAPEIFGYPKHSTEQITKRVANYGSGNVSSWTDIHNEVDGGRLIFVVDSAGHPRYRRTAVRGLLSWVPHWTLCCIAADDDEETSGEVGATLKSEDILGLPGADVDLSKAHLELCLKLELPLVVVITKFDLASKAGLRQALAKVLSTLKSYGRRPFIISAEKSGRAVQAEHELNSIPENVEEEVKSSLKANNKEGLYDDVPIILTSAVTGIGINTVHALLRQLPIPTLEAAKLTSIHADDTEHRLPETLFHIDEVFQRANDSQDTNFILGGVFKYGQLSLGDELLLGPFAPETIEDDDLQPEMLRSRSYPGQSLGTLDSVYRESPPLLSRIHLGQGSTKGSPSGDMWRVVRVVSLRNLRLAVRRLECDQVGTIGVVFAGPTIRSFIPRVRRGMVLLPATGHQDNSPSAYAGFTALFDHAQVASLSINTSVIAYIASIRAPAKITRAEMLSPGPVSKGERDMAGEDIMWGLDENENDDGGVELSDRPKDRAPCEIAVTLRFINYREWIEAGTKVLIMLGGGEKGDKGSLGLKGFVGQIIDGIF